MPEISESIQEARHSGYSDKEIAEYLGSKGYGDKIETARQSGYTYSDIIGHLSGEKTGFVNRAKQGMADFYLSTKQMGEYVGDKVGLGDIEFGTEGIKYISPEELSQRREITQGAIQGLEQQKGEGGIWASLAQAAGNPASWMGAAALSQPLKVGTKLGGLGAPITQFTRGQAIAQGAKMGAVTAGAYELGLPQEGEFDPVKKAQEVATTAGIGAIAVPGLEEVVRLASKLSPVGYAARKGGDIIRGVAAPFGAGARRRAENRIKGLVASPEDAASLLNEQPVASALSPAQRTGEPGLLGMENTIAGQTPEAEKALLSQKQLAGEQLDQAAGQIGGGVTPQKTTGFIDDRRTNLINKLNQSAQEAQKKAADRISALAPERRASEASVIVREELETAMRGARATEKELWGAIPKAGLSTTGMRAKYLDLVNNTPKAQAGDIPEAAHKFLDPKSKTKFKNIESTKELYGLRSELLKEARNSRAGDTPNFNKARIAEELADAILDDLGAQAGKVSGKVGQPLRVALDYSRQLNQTYGQGSVGKILGSQRSGAERIAPEMTLESTIGSGKTKGGVAVNEMVQAAGASPQLRQGIQDYVVNQFNRAAIKDGALNPASARKFISDNADILDTFPDLKQGIEQAISASESAAAKTGRAETIGKSLFSKEQSYAAEFLGAPVEREFERIIKAQNPAQAAREISKMAAKDKTGQATLGMKTAVSEYLMGNANGSGEKLLGLLKDKRIGASVREILSADEVKLMTQIAREMSAIEGKTAKNVGKSIMNDVPSKLIEYPLRMIAAKTPSKFGLGTIQASGMASENAKNLINSLHNKGKAEQFIIQAFHDPALMKILLTETTTPAQKKVVEKKLEGWISKNQQKVDALLLSPNIQHIQEEEPK